jgi:hypothetical protein
MTISPKGEAAATYKANALFDQCPECNSNRFQIVTDGTSYTNFQCASCGRCWHVDFGRVSRVDPLSCTGCPDHNACMSRLPRDDIFATYHEEVVLDLRSTTSQHTTDMTVQDIPLPHAEHAVQIGPSSGH